MKLDVIGATGFHVGLQSPRVFLPGAGTALIPSRGVERTLSLVCDMARLPLARCGFTCARASVDALALSHRHADSRATSSRCRCTASGGRARALWPMSPFGPGETLHRVRQIEGAPEGESYEEFALTQLRLGDTYDAGLMTIQPNPALHPCGAFRSFGDRGPSERILRAASSCSIRVTPTCAPRLLRARGADVRSKEWGFTR